MKQFILLVALLVPVSAGAGTIEKQIVKLKDGYARMSFASRKGVCGNGHGSISFGRDRHGFHWNSTVDIRSDSDDEWWDDCEEGPVRVSLRVRRGEVTKLRAYVGGHWRADDDVTDLGTVSPQDAVDFLLSLARRERSGVAEDAILPAVLAKDVVVWPDLLEIARDRSLTRDARKSAVFWLGQLASEKATEGLTKLVDDDDVELEIREAAVFSLSQLDNDRTFEELAEIARTSPHPQLRKAALFWLAQSDDPRALDVFEGILTQ